MICDCFIEFDPADVEDDRLAQAIVLMERAEVSFIKSQALKQAWGRGETIQDRSDCMALMPWRESERCCGRLVRKLHGDPKPMIRSASPSHCMQRSV